MNAPKICTCCGKTITAAQWAALPCLGVLPSEDDHGRPTVLELRNCTCGSTLALEVKP